MELKNEDGKKLIAYARKNLIHYLKTDQPLPIPPEMRQKYNEKRGAFVTYKKRSQFDKSLRGCIGYVLPYLPLIETIQKVSISAAVEDPRFPRVKQSEVEKLEIEISVLTVPEVIEVEDPKDYPKKIKIGKDGLIISKGGKQGLLLPQVPIEQDPVWDAKTFLRHTCQKAWLPANAWKDKKTTIKKFQAQIFNESDYNWNSSD